MGQFKVVSDYTPSGDQPQAIDTLASGIENGLRDQVLLGVTGSGKTYTMAKVIERCLYTHLRAHETDSYLVCRLLLEKKKKN